MPELQEIVPMPATVAKGQGVPKALRRNHVIRRFGLNWRFVHDRVYLERCSAPIDVRLWMSNRGMT